MVVIYKTTYLLIRFRLDIILICTTQRLIMQKLFLTGVDIFVTPWQLLIQTKYLENAEDELLLIGHNTFLP